MTVASGLADMLAKGPDETLAECLACVVNGEAPPAWNARHVALQRERNHIEALLSDPAVRVYGTNTLCGHRDAERVSDVEVAAEDVIASHAIGGPPWHGTHAARCIGYAKLYAWAAGGSGVSPALFGGVRELVSDPMFRPQVPRGATYSCGDVIPAAHWARSVLEELARRRAYRAGVGEIMALINGAFVHVGYAVHAAARLERAWALTTATAAAFHALTGANASNLHTGEKDRRTRAARAVSYVRGRAWRPLTTAHRQDPVSLRAIPQLMDAWCAAIDDFLLETGGALERPSANPFIDLRHPFPLSQASFLAPSLEIRTGALIEAVLLMMWALQGWTKHLLSGRVQGVPRDAATAGAPLGLIQHAKRVMALGAEARARLGRRTFVDGADASYGIEDLWTHGVGEIDRLVYGLDTLERMLCMGLEAVCRAVDDHGLGERLPGELLEVVREAAGGGEHRTGSEHLEGHRLEKVRRLFWG